MLKGDSTEISIVERFAAGSSAGAFAQTCIYPLEVSQYTRGLHIDLTTHIQQASEQY